MASKKGHASIVQKLIDAGASVDLQEKVTLSRSFTSFRDVAAAILYKVNFRIHSHGLHNVHNALCRIVC